MGFSYGAAVVLTAALRRPQRVASLVVLDGEYPVKGWGDELAVTLDLVSAQLSVESVMERLAITNRRKAERLRGRIDTLVHHTSLREDVPDEPELHRRRPAPRSATRRWWPTAASPTCWPGGHRLAALLPDVEYHELAGRRAPGRSPSGPPTSRR